MIITRRDAACHRLFFLRFVDNYFAEVADFCGKNRTFA